MISDGEIGERERLLSRACELARGAACKRFGDVLIGKNSERARSAYESACRSSREEAACKTARVNEVQTIEQWRAACVAGVADACTKLGDALYAIDAPRAVRLFVNECALRGVEHLAGGVGRFVAERARGPHPTPAASRGVSQSASAGADEIHPTVRNVDGSVALVVVQRALQLYAGDLARCVEGTSKTPERSLDAELVVDLTGDVWRATAVSSSLTAPETACLLTTLEGFAFGGPLPAPALVRVSIAVGIGPTGSR
jgi:hypothetical protein